MSTMDSTAAVDTFIGRTIAGRFEVVAVLGEGGMGKVYTAKDRETGQLAAVKVVHGKVWVRLFFDGNITELVEHRVMVWPENAEQMKAHLLKLTERVFKAHRAGERACLVAKETKRIRDAIKAELPHLKIFHGTSSSNCFVTVGDDFAHKLMHITMEPTMNKLVTFHLPNASVEELVSLLKLIAPSFSAVTSHDLEYET